MTIIGITGTFGSGKGTVVQYLKDKYGFKHYSARAFISEEVSRRNLPDIRDNLRLVANELRTSHGSSYVAEQLYNRALQDGQNSVIESLRSTGEITALRNKPQSFFLLAVDAAPKVRYERILLRKSSTDTVSFEKFLQDESYEMNDTSPGGMNIAQCMKMADGYIENNGDIDALHEHIVKLVEPLLH